MFATWGDAGRARASNQGNMALTPVFEEGAEFSVRESFSLETFLPVGEALSLPLLFCGRGFQASIRECNENG